MFVSAMPFVEARVPIASHRGVAARALSRRSAGKSSWRKVASECGEVGDSLGWTKIMVEFSFVVNPDAAHVTPAW
jgi:hypothetical protein